MFTDILHFCFLVWAKLIKRDFHIRVSTVGEMRANWPTEGPTLLTAVDEVTITRDAVDIKSTTVNCLPQVKKYTLDIPLMKSRRWVADEHRQSLWCVCEVIAVGSGLMKENAVEYRVWE